MITLSILLFLFLCIGVLVYCWYRLKKEVAIHAANNQDTPEKYHLPFEPVTFTSQDGLTFSGWLVPVPKPKAVVILVHGRSVKYGGKTTMLDHALYLYENGYSTFLFDMRGFGESQGNAIGFGEKEWMDVEGAYKIMRSRLENKNVKIGFLGISVGAGSALIAAGKKDMGDFIIASTPYYSHAMLFAFQVAKERIFPKFIFTMGLRIAACFVLGIQYFLQEPYRFVANIKAPI